LFQPQCRRSLPNSDRSISILGFFLIPVDPNDDDRRLWQACGYLWPQADGPCRHRAISVCFGACRVRMVDAVDNRLSSPARNSCRGNSTRHYDGGRRSLSRQSAWQGPRLYASWRRCAFSVSGTGRIPDSGLRQVYVEGLTAPALIEQVHENPQMLEIRRHRRPLRRSPRQPTAVAAQGQRSTSRRNNRG